MVTCVADVNGAVCLYSQVGRIAKLRREANIVFEPGRFRFSPTVGGCRTSGVRRMV